jgi:hypothetical protein
LHGVTINPQKQKLKKLQEMAWWKHNVPTNKDVQGVQPRLGREAETSTAAGPRGAWVDKGIVVYEESLEIMLSSCLPFTSEITELQAKGGRLTIFAYVDKWTRLHVIG